MWNKTPNFATIGHVNIHLGCDHAAYETMQTIAKHLRDAGHTVTDHGPTSYDALDDYPEFCLNAAQAVAKDTGSLGIVAGGSGNGEQIAANKVNGIRAALAWNTEIARLARQHNNANILSVGARMHDVDELLAIIDAFIAEPFSGDERHERRIGQMAHFEQQSTVLPSGTSVTADGAVIS